MSSEPNKKLLITVTHSWQGVSSRAGSPPAAGVWSSEPWWLKSKDQHSCPCSGTGVRTHPLLRWRDGMEISLKTEQSWITRGSVLHTSHWYWPKTHTHKQALSRGHAVRQMCLGPWSAASRVWNWEKVQGQESQGAKLQDSGRSISLPLKVWMCSEGSVHE